MSNPDQTAPSHEYAMPAFPVPRDWLLGWESDAWAGAPYQQSTLDFDLNVPDSGYYMINNLQPPPDARTDSR